MLNLDVEDRKQLITLLNAIPVLGKERSRLELLELSGLQQLIPMIDISGASFVAISEIVSNLSKHGRLNCNNEPLGLFINTIKGFVGVQQQEFLNRMLTKYDLLTPIAAIPDIHQWRGEEQTADVLEKIIGENTLRPIAFLHQGLKVARSVAYIGVHLGCERWSGTGFLVSKDLLLTNNHVLPNPDLLINSLFRFNYEEDFSGRSQPCEEYHAKPNGIFHTNQALDYTLVQLDGEPGQEWGWLPLQKRDVKHRDRVNIIQHPEGKAKEVSFQNNFIEYIGEDVVQYVTSTLNGSSGSPVFNDRWEVVALHHAGGNIPEPVTNRRYLRNEGIAIQSILADLPLKLGTLLM